MKATAAGYSGTPLARKLGLKPAMRVLELNAPAHFHALLPDAPLGVVWLGRAGPFDCGIAFAASVAAAQAIFMKLEPKLAQDSMIWIAWPKKAAGLKTDLDENLVRDLGLATGLVDIKVCAIDATWSGLKFVRRVRDRIKS